MVVLLKKSPSVTSALVLCALRSIAFQQGRNSSLLWYNTLSVFLYFIVRKNNKLTWICICVLLKFNTALELFDLLEEKEAFYRSAQRGGDSTTELSLSVIAKRRRQQMQTWDMHQRSIEIHSLSTAVWFSRGGGKLFRALARGLSPKL